MNSKNFRESIREQIPKSQWVYPHLEDVVLNKKYAFTVNAGNKKSVHETVDFYCDLFGQFPTGVKFELRPEISTKSTLLHYHGWIMFTTSIQVAQFYWTTIPMLKESSTFSVDGTIESYDWYLYCIKQRHFIKPYLTYLRIHYKIRDDRAEPFFIKRRRPASASLDA